MTDDLEPGGGTDAAAALRTVAEHGPFFTVHLGTPDPDAPTLRSLYRGHGLRALVEDTGARLGGVEPRVAASTFFLGWAARLASPVLGCAQRCGALLELPPSSTRWSTAGPHAEHPRVTVLPADDAAAASALTGALIDAHVRPMIAALRAEVPVAEPLLYGNVASALHGALLVLAHGGQAQRADAMVRTLLASGPLAGTARVDPAFRRNSCCLFYRVPGGGLCGDCVLSAIPGGTDAGEN